MKAVFYSFLCMFLYCVVIAVVEFIPHGCHVLCHAFNSIFGYVNLLESSEVGGIVNMKLIMNEIIRRERAGCITRLQRDLEVAK